MIFPLVGVLAVAHRTVTEFRVVTHESIRGAANGEEAEAGTAARVTVTTTRKVASLRGVAIEITVLKRLHRDHVPPRRNEVETSDRPLSRVSCCYVRDQVLFCQPSAVGEVSTINRCNTPNWWG